MERRVIAVGLVSNKKGELLICKMAPDRGVFPDEWGLPGGGIEPDENMYDALRREMNEEIGVNITDIQPALFKDGSYQKSFADGTKRKIYMIFLLFHCKAVKDSLSLNDEFSEYAWVPIEKLSGFKFNTETVDTFKKLGYL